MQLVELLTSHIASLLLVLLLAGGGSNWGVVAQDGSASNLLDNCQGWSLGASSPCEFTEPVYLAYRAVRRYYIPVPPGAVYDMAITVSSTLGDVDIQLLGPNGTLLASSEERIGEDVVQAGRTILSRYPGNYSLVLQAMAQSESKYIVRIQTSVAVTLLAPSDRAVLAAIAAQCCAPDDDLLPDSCSTLITAISPNATQQDDLCLQPPNMCDAQGHLTKLVLSGGDRGNFVCPSLPPELGQLSALQVLDWTSNGQVGTLASVASVLAPLSASLKRLYLGRNALSGPLGCQLVDGTALEILRLERNLLTGTVPACLFQSPSLKQLSLAGNLLLGPIPDLPPACALRLIDLSENGPPDGLSSSNPGMQGKLPDLSRAVNLTYLNLQSNSLTGTIPPLPSSLQVLQLSYNRLGGPLPPSLESAADLRVLDLSRNGLTGNLPPRVSGSPLLTVLRLAGNRLGGALPEGMGAWGPYLMDVDLSENAFTGTNISELLSRPSLLKLNLAANGLSFNISAMAASVPVNNSLLYFNVSNNNVVGELTEPLGRMLMFKKLLLEATQDDEALQGRLPPKPLFDISYNNIESVFPLSLLPLLASLYWASYDYMPLSVVLQPQKPSSWLSCPSASTPTPPGADFLEELQQLYDLSCMTPLGQRINISAFHNVTLPRPARWPAPPRPPPPLPPRPPIRRAPPEPGTSSATNSDSDSGSGAGARGPQQPPGSLSQSPAGGASSGSGSSADREGSSAQGAGSGGLQPGATGPGPGAQSSVVTAATTGRAGKGGGGVGAIVGGVAGGVVVVAVVVGLLYRRHSHRRNAHASKRVPLTFNSAYEAPSEGTASNYADMQMFEFKMGERPPRVRNRL